MKNNFKKGIAMVMASVMMAGTLAVSESYFDNSTLVYAATYTSSDISIFELPTNYYVNYVNEGLFAVRNNDKLVGCVDSSGQEVIPFIYNGINNFIDGFSIFDNDGKKGIIDTNGI